MRVDESVYFSLFRCLSLPQYYTVGKTGKMITRMRLRHTYINAKC